MSADSKYPPSVKAGKPELEHTPLGWKKDTLNHYLKLKQRKVKIEDETEYDLVTVKRSRGGVVRREHLLGKQISVKSQFALKTGDFLISKRQIVHGACGIVPEHLDGSIVSNEYSIFTAKENFDLTYLSYLSETLYFQQTCFHSSIGVHIEKMIFKLDNWFKWEFNIPPLPEQRKIAKILSTWDQAIATTERLIAASQQQKKALMQQLLTGKKRLVNPETGKVFEGDWETVKLNKLGKCLTGLTYSPEEVCDSGMLVLRSSNIQNGKLCFDDNVFVNKAVKDELKTKYGDILVCVRNGSRNLIGKSAFITDKAVGQTHGAFMTLFRGKYPEFVYQLFQSSQFYKQVNMNLGATINSINTSDLHLFKFKIPHDVAEIKKIASVLTAADQEIELLEAKLAHLKDEKKALMQQLLTGKRRVNVDAAEVA